MSIKNLFLIINVISTIGHAKLALIVKPALKEQEKIETNRQQKLNTLALSATFINMIIGVNVQYALYLHSGIKQLFEIIVYVT